MRFLPIAVMAVTIACSTSSVASTAHDNELLRIGAVDSSYRYVNLDYAERFFRELQTQLRTLLPLKVDDGVWVTGVEATPYLTKYIYHTDNVFSKNELADAKKYFSNPDIVKELCSGVYQGNYQRANNTIGYADYYDSSGAQIASVMLNNRNCS